MRIELLYVSAEKLLYYLGTYDSWRAPLALVAEWDRIYTERQSTAVRYWYVRRLASTVQLILSECPHPVTEVV